MTTTGPLSVRVQQQKTAESHILEALLIHLRNLLHFLHANGQKGDLLPVFGGDLIARNYAGSGATGSSPT